MKKITLLFTLFAFAFGFAQNGGDDCASAVVVTAGSFTDTTINDVTAGTNNGDSAWFSFTAPSNGTMAISVCADPDDPDTRVFVFTDGCGTLTPVANDDDGCAGTFESTLATPVTAATEYLIQWDDRWSVDPFDWELVFVACTPPTVDAPTVVDDCANNMFSIDINFTDLGNSTALTITNSVNADVVNVNALGIATIGPFPTGAPVDFTINHENDADCNLQGTNFTDTCPPSNDECAGAIAINCDDTVTGSTLGATDSGGNSNAANDVWYSYTGSGIAEDVTVTLCNSGYDTAVRVYTDCSVTAGAQVLFNDDACGTGGTRSEGTFASDGTTTYYIMVEGWNASNGAYELSITCAANVPAPPNDLCSNAEALTIDVLTGGTTAGATDDSTGGDDDTSCEGFTFKSDVWYTFMAPDTDVSIQTFITGDSDQANVAVYSSIDCSQLDADSIACSNGNGGEAFDVTGLTMGNTYYVRVWSDGVALAPEQGEQNRIEGTFNIVVNNELLSVDSIEAANGFEYFPNPVNDNLSLRAQDNIQNIAVYNMLGQQVTKMTPNALTSEVNMANLSQGAYFVKVTINNTTQTIRILKK